MFDATALAWVPRASVDRTFALIDAVHARIVVRRIRGGLQAHEASMVLHEDAQVDWAQAMGRPSSFADAS